jgi:hypothetical protein
MYSNWMQLQRVVRLCTTRRSQYLQCNSTRTRTDASTVLAVVIVLQKCLLPVVLAAYTGRMHRTYVSEMRSTMLAVGISALDSCSSHCTVSVLVQHLQ